MKYSFRRCLQRGLSTVTINHVHDGCGACSQHNCTLRLFFSCYKNFRIVGQLSVVVLVLVELWTAESLGFLLLSLGSFTSTFSPFPPGNFSCSQIILINLFSNDLVEGFNCGEIPQVFFWNAEIFFYQGWCFFVCVKLKKI